MILDTNSLYEILAVKHNCSLKDLVEHIRLLGTHFSIGPVYEDVVFDLLKEIQEYGEYQIVDTGESEDPSKDIFIQKRMAPE